MPNRRTQADPAKLLLGTGELYFNGIFVGTLGDNVTFTYTPEFAEQRGGDMLAASRAVKTKEEVMLEAGVAEFKLENLKYALGNSNSIEAGPFELIRTEYITLNGTTPVALAETAVGTIKVFNTTRGVEYELTNDYTFATNEVTRVALGDIADGQVVLVEYRVSVTATRKLAGGGSCDVPVFQLDFVHKECDDKGVQITIFRAFANTELEAAFNTKESGDFTLHNISFKGLADNSKIPGKNLYEIITEN